MTLSVTAQRALLVAMDRTAEVGWTKDGVKELLDDKDNFFEILAGGMMLLCDGADAPEKADIERAMKIANRWYEVYKNDVLKDDADVVQCKNRALYAAHGCLTDSEMGAAVYLIMFGAVPCAGDTDNFTLGQFPAHAFAQVSKAAAAEMAAGGRPSTLTALIAAIGKVGQKSLTEEEATVMFLEWRDLVVSAAQDSSLGHEIMVATASRFSLFVDSTIKECRRSTDALGPCSKELLHVYLSKYFSTHRGKGIPVIFDEGIWRAAGGPRHVYSMAAPSTERLEAEMAEMKLLVNQAAGDARGALKAARGGGGGGDYSGPGGSGRCPHCGDCPADHWPRKCPKLAAAKAKTD